MPRHSSKELLYWTAAALLAAVALSFLFPLLFDFYPRSWSVNRAEAREIALERFGDLGEPVEDPYVVTRLVGDPTLERRLQLAAEAGGGGAGIARSLPAGRVLGWEVSVYEPAARPFEWTYRAWVSPAGEVLALQLRVGDAAGGSPVEPAEARRRADRFLAAAGFDLDRFEEPRVRRRDLGSRTDLVLRYRDREAVLGEEVPYGLEVTLAGDRMAGFSTWTEDSGRKDLEAGLQLIGLVNQARIWAPYLIFPFIAVVFLRRYHAGEVGVRRSVQVFLLVFACGVVLTLLTSRGAIEGSSFGILSRRQMTWAWALQLLLLWFAPLALVAALSWSAGEAESRERWGRKLAAFDAPFRGRLDNATVARSAVRGLAAGVVLAGAVFAAAALLAPSGVDPMVSFLFGPWYENAGWAGIGLAVFGVVYVLFTELFARLFLLTAWTWRFGRGLAAAGVVGVSMALFFPPLVTLPGGTGLVFSAIAAAGLVALFLAYDLLTALLASFVLLVTIGGLPFLFADDPFLQLQGALPLALAALPAALTLRHLGGRELVYRYEDVPAHVRRIAERERQRVELETARNIQSSILPELPPRLAGVDLAHAYLPATEVGGDFYDVLALEDGRLALAVGDVAGHGVSSGLVMSMAKSALAVQVTFDPEVRSVFRTLNRMVHQTARKRLLTTLCYAVLDPKALELVYASAGHLFPYRIGRDGRVRALESVAYPLGVRGDLEVAVQKVRLAAGDTLFFFSDGVVEAHPSGSDEMFGFDRLEASLARHAGAGPEALRDGVLADLATHVGPGLRDDDQTLLVVRLDS